MRMQEPEQWQSSEPAGTIDQEYGAYRGQAERDAQEYSTYREETGRNEQEQKIYPQESRVSVLNILTIVFSAIGLGPTVVGIVGSALVIHYANGSPYLLTGGILGLVGSIVALLLFKTIFILSIITAVRRARLFRRLRFR